MSRRVCRTQAYLNPEFQDPSEKVTTYSESLARIGLFGTGGDIGPRNILLDNNPLVLYNYLGSFLDRSPT